MELLEIELFGHLSEYLQTVCTNHISNIYLKKRFSIIYPAMVYMSQDKLIDLQFKLHCNHSQFLCVPEL